MTDDTKSRGQATVRLICEAHHIDTMLPDGHPELRQHGWGCRQTVIAPKPVRIWEAEAVWIALGKYGDHRKRNCLGHRTRWLARWLHPFARIVLANRIWQVG